MSFPLWLSKQSYFMLLCRYYSFINNNKKNQSIMKTLPATLYEIMNGKVPAHGKNGEESISRGHSFFLLFSCALFMLLA